MSSLDLSKLQNALDNEENSFVLNLTDEKIEQNKRLALRDLYLEADFEDEILELLEDYVFVDEIPQFKSGSYIRWISLKDPDNIKLTRGATICDVDLREGGTYIICKNNYGRKTTCFQIKVDENFIFRKLNPQEKVLLSVVNYLSKN